ncbi:MAG: hypothetical protein JW854_09105 [Actinobacteria bacterium]|nr:hypothetical protein [Actinomycetota bacterium]
MDFAKPHRRPDYLRACAVTFIIALCTGTLVYGCGESSIRDLSTPHTALLGQWEPLTAGAAYIFFSPDTATYLPKESGESIALRYEVVEEDLGGFELKLRYIGQGDTTEPFTIAFSQDRNGFFLYPAGVPERLEYSYVGDRQQP